MIQIDDSSDEEMIVGFRFTCCMNVKSNATMEECSCEGYSPYKTIATVVIAVVVAIVLYCCPPIIVLITVAVV